MSAPRGSENPSLYSPVSGYTTGQILNDRFDQSNLFRVLTNGKLSDWRKPKAHKLSSLMEQTWSPAKFSENRFGHFKLWIKKLKHFIVRQLWLFEDKYFSMLRKVSVWPGLCVLSLVLNDIYLIRKWTCLVFSHLLVLSSRCGDLKS